MTFILRINSMLTTIDTSSIDLKSPWLFKLKSKFNVMKFKRVHNLIIKYVLSYMNRKSVHFQQPIFKDITSEKISSIKG